MSKGGEIRVRLEVTAPEWFGEVSPLIFEPGEANDSDTGKGELVYRKYLHNVTKIIPEDPANCKRLSALREHRFGERRDADADREARRETG